MKITFINTSDFVELNMELAAQFHSKNIPAFPNLALLALF